MPAHLDLITLCKIEKLPLPVTEYKFNPSRKWRADYAWPSYKLAVEIEGGIFQLGWHQSISIMLKNMEKYNDYSILGWSLLRFTPGMVSGGEAAKILKNWFDARKENL